MSGAAQPKSNVRKILDTTIYAGVADEANFIPQAQNLIRMIEAYEGRQANNSTEITEWSASHLDISGKFYVLRGTKSST